MASWARAAQFCSRATTLGSGSATQPLREASSNTGSIVLRPAQQWRGMASGESGNLGLDPVLAQERKDTEHLDSYQASGNHFGLSRWMCLYEGVNSSFWFNQRTFSTASNGLETLWRSCSFYLIYDDTFRYCKCTFHAYQAIQRTE